MSQQILKSETQKAFEEILNLKEDLNYFQLKNLYDNNKSKFSCLEPFINLNSKTENNKMIFLEVLRFLLTLNVDVNSENDDEKTLLMQSILNKNVLALEFLLENNADPNKKGADEWNSVHQAAILKETEDYLKLLFKFKGNVFEKNEKLQLPLHLAAGKNRNYNVNSILYRMLELTESFEVFDSKDFLGMTPFNKAVSSGSFEAAREFLLFEKAYKNSTNSGFFNPNDQDNEGNTSLHYAFEHGHYDLVEEICKLKKIIPVKNKDGKYCYEMTKDESLKEKFLNIISN